MNSIKIELNDSSEDKRIFISYDPEDKSCHFEIIDKDTMMDVLVDGAELERLLLLATQAFEKGLINHESSEQIVKSLV